jgi:hypothetical protein
MLSVSVRIPLPFFIAFNSRQIAKQITNASNPNRILRRSLGEPPAYALAKGPDGIARMTDHPGSPWEV